MAFHPMLEQQLRALGLPDERAGWQAHPLRDFVLAVDATYRELTARLRDGGVPPEAGGASLTLPDERILRLLRVSSDWYWETDANGRVIHLLGGFSRVTGFAEDEAIARRPDEIWPNSPDVALGSMLHRALVERRPFADLAVSVNHANGDTLGLRLTGGPMHDRQGRFVGFSGLAHDVTAEQRARREAER